MANIFISSTYKDLKDYRERVSNVIRKMGHIDIAMEYYGAEDKRPLDKCLEDVAACDLYIGIFAWRYGYIPPGHEKSITELEYRKARECNKHCLIFLLKDDAPWPMNLVEKENIIRIEALRKEISNNHLPAFFSSIDELSGCVAEAIYKNVPSSVTLSSNQELNTKAYYNAILKQYKTLDLNALTPPEKADFMEIQLHSVFVEQDVRENPPPVEIPKELLEKLIKDEKLKEDDIPEGLTLEDIKKAKEAYFGKPALAVLEVITNPKHQYIAILGDPGSGKSTLSRYLILSLITKEDDRLNKAFDGYLPLLIELRDYAAECIRNKCDTFIEYLDFLGKTKGLGLTKKALDNYLKNDGKAIVIFDGLDEIFDPDQRENIKKQMVGLIIDYPNARIIVTSRMVGYTRNILANAGFSHYKLQDFRKPQIDAFIDKWYSIALINNPDEARARKKRINRSIDDSPSINQLAGNPLLLTIMAIINKHQELPRERWKLYEHASGVLIHHWDWERRIKEWNIKIEYVSKDDKEELLRRIAYLMQSAPKGLAGNYIHADTLQAEFEKYFIDRYQRNPADAKLAAKVLIEQLRERNFILCRFGSNLYGFIHRTFLEYFCAWAFVWKFNMKHEIDIEYLKSIFNEHWEDESWHEVIRLICGMIDEKFAGKLIDHLIALPSKYTELIDAKIFDKLWYESDAGRVEPLNIDLAIKCMGELKNLELIKNTSSNLLEKTCEWIVYNMDYIAPFKSEPNLILSAASVGKRWPGREKLKDWIPKFAKRFEKFSDRRWSHSFFIFRGSEYLGKFIGSIGSGDESIRESIEMLLKRNNPSLRYLALRTLESGWHDDPDTLKLFQEHALNDSYESVRYGAITMLSRGWWRGDIETLEILKVCALRDKDFSVRKSAIQVISAAGSDYSQVLPFLGNLARSATEFKVRQIAVQQIGKMGGNNVDALELLKDRAVNDTYSGVRELAVSLLCEQWKDNPTVLSILRERVTREPNPTIREIIYKILAKKDAGNVF
ncbi:Uncharacterised protein [uncultured archaeon]|nr:Uncharacterised protein [uncultured archaeon]